MPVTSKEYLGENIVAKYESSNIQQGTYNIPSKKLIVVFKSGASYEYDDVPHDVFAELNLSESQGKYFNTKISKNYTYRKL